MSLEPFYARVGADALAEDDRLALEKAVCGAREYGPGKTVLEPGEHPRQLHLVAAGWASRCVIREDGTRQITDVLLPGDLCDLSSLALAATDRVSALTAVTIVLLDRAGLTGAMEAHPRIARAILRLAVGEQTVLRAWVGCFGLRDKREHAAHLLCELHWRLRRSGLGDDHEFDLPLTQANLAHVLGISAVHMNRVLKDMRREGLISLDGRRVRILHPRRLRELAEFDPSYLLAWDGSGEQTVRNGPSASGRETVLGG